MRVPLIGIGWRAWALVLVNGVLATAIGLRLWKGTETAAILLASPLKVKTPVLHVDLPPLYSDFRGLTDRTPFYASRRLYVEASPAASLPLPVPKYVFDGALIRQHGLSVALLNDPASRSTVRVSAGKDLDGWRVESVEASRVVLRHENEHAEIARITKEAAQSAATAGITRVHVANGNRVESGGGVHVLGGGQTASRVMPATTNLPPLAGSGSESVYIPPPPH